MNVLKTSVAVLLVLICGIRSANGQSEPDIPPPTEAPAVLEALEMAGDLSTLAASIGANQDDESLNAAIEASPSRYYLLSEPMKNHTRLWRLNFLSRLPWIRNQSWADRLSYVERYFWYLSAPAIFALKGIPLYLATGNLTVTILIPLAFFFPKYFAMLLAKTAMWLQFRAWVVDQWHMDTVDDGVPGLKRILRLNGQSMVNRARVVDELSSTTFFILEVDAKSPPLPEDFTVAIPQNGQLVQAQPIEIPSMENSQFVLSLRGFPGAEQLPRWTLSFEDMQKGQKPAEDLRRLWWHHAEEHFQTATINMTMIVDGQEKEIGPLASLQGVGAMLGHGMIDHEVFWIPLAIYARQIRLLQRSINDPRYLAISAYSKEELEAQLADVYRRRDRVKRWSSAVASLLKKKVRLRASGPTPPREVGPCDFMLMH